MNTYQQSEVNMKKSSAMLLSTLLINSTDGSLLPERRPSQAVTAASEREQARLLASAEAKRLRKARKRSGAEKAQLEQEATEASAHNLSARIRSAS